MRHEKAKTEREWRRCRHAFTDFYNRLLASEAPGPISEEKYEKKYGRTYYEKNKNELNKKRRLRQKTDIQYRLSRVLGLSLWRTIKYRGKVKKK